MSHTHGSPAIPTAPTSSRGRTLAVSVGFLAFAVVVQTVVTVGAALGYLSLGGALDAPFALVLLTIPGQLAMLVLGYLFVTRRLDGVRAAALSTGDVGLVAAGSALVLVVALGGSAALEAVGLAAPPDAMLIAAEAEPLVLLAFAALSLVLVGPAEELFFRGAIQGNLRTAFGPALAIGLTGLLFGLVHVTGFLSAGVALSPAVWAALSLNVLSGVVFGVLYERSGNLVVPVLVHGLSNAVAFVALFLTF